MSNDLHNLYSMPEHIHTRWASAENWDAAVGAGGQVAGGRKGSSFFVLAAGESRNLAHVSGASGTLGRIWCSLSDRSPSMLRGLRLLLSGSA